MKDSRSIVRLASILAVCGVILGPEARAQLPDQAEAFVVRLMHPDQQAAEVLRLFEGSRWTNPAAALAAWKQGVPDGAGLGKATEAVIALFNPEMTAEWRALDGAELRIAFNAATGGIGWFALIPADDGTVAAGITASRLTNPDDPPLLVDGLERPVARLGKSGAPLACQVGTTIVVAGSRDGLQQGAALARVARGKGPVPRLDSGTVFRLEPGRIPTPRNASLGHRRIIEALRAVGSRSVDGTACLQDGTFVLDVTNTLERSRLVDPEHRHPGVQPSWLEGLPSAGVMAMISLAIDPEPSSWDWAFAVADRVERVDPVRAGLAPLRSRLNLLLAAAGVKLEADIHPHLLGISACLLGDPDRPARVAGTLVILHLDDPSVADRLARQGSTRLGAILGANAAGRAATVRCRGRDIWMASGDGAASALEDRRHDAGRSIATWCGGWLDEGRQAPARVGAFWPTRLWRPVGLPDLPRSALRALADDPPVVWWGWSEAGREHDLFRWRGLRDRVRRILELVPPNAR